jgi:uncharacterized protein YdeI (BOF family)
MKLLSRLNLLCLLALVMLCLSFQLNAQQGSAPSQQDEQQPQQQQPQTQPSQQSPSPDAQPQNAPDPSDHQIFTGTIVKSGDRYVLQDSDTGKTYDIDRQDLAQNHVGKEVRVPGTLDPDGKMIHVK